MCVNLLLLVKGVLKQTSSTLFLNYPTSNYHREQRKRRYTQEKKEREKVSKERDLEEEEGWESENSVFAALVLRQFSVYATILRNHFIFIPRK